MYTYQMRLFAHLNSLLGPPRIYSRASGCGALRSSARTLRCMFRSRPSSVARALFEGIAYREAEPRKDMETPKKISFSLFCCCVTPATPISQDLYLVAATVRCKRSRASSSSHCDGHGRCFCVACVCVPCFLST